MRIAPDEVNVELPRALVGGIKRRPVEELLRRVAGDYAELFKQNIALKEAIAALELERDAHASTGTPASPELRPTVAREHDELARLVLSTAKQVSAELRDSARRDSELMLRKASARSRALERERAAREGELAELERLRDETRTAMRSALQAALALPGGAEAH